MTGANYFYSTHNETPLPTRQEQHRFASNVLSAGDFCTEYPCGHTIERVENSLKWTIKNAEKRNQVFRY